MPQDTTRTVGGAHISAATVAASEPVRGLVWVSSLTLLSLAAGEAPPHAEVTPWKGSSPHSACFLLLSTSVVDGFQ